MLKPHKSFNEQLQLLLQRGLTVDDPQAALRTIERIGYYRLAGYFYPLRQTNPPGQPGRRDAFMRGASFELIVQLYEFDKQLRLLVLDAAERLEVALRVCIAHDLGKRAPDAHKRPEFFDGRFTAPWNGQSALDRWLQKLAERMSSSHDDFVQHHRLKYGGEMPIWVTIELWDFGMLSRFYAGLRFKDRARLAGTLGGLTAPELVSWLKTLNFVRNVAAHHSRLWNRNVPEVPRMPAAAANQLLSHLHAHQATYRVYGALCCAQYLLRHIHPEADWAERLRAHVNTFPKSPLLGIESAGFPQNWEAEKLWA